MDLDLVELIFAVLLGSGGLVLLASLVSRARHRRMECRALAGRVICRLCLHAFQSADSDPVVRCPACGAATERHAQRRPE